MRQIENIFSRQIEGKKTPSVIYAFFDKDTVIYSNATGYKNVKSMEGVDFSTTYNLFSLTKTFTALAILQFVQEGKVQLNSPASHYLPGFPYSDEITVEQLLTHTSGIPSPMPMKWIRLANEQREFNRDLFFNDVFKRHSRLVHKPGTKFKYSNLGYVLLGRLIESVTGEAYEGYITRCIIDRAGVSHDSLGFVINDELQATGYQRTWSLGNVLLGYLLDKKKFMRDTEKGWSPFNNFYVNGISYGGLIGSIEGLIKYAQALIHKDSTLLNEKHKQILFSENQIGSHRTGMSHAWFRGFLKGHPYVTHAGGGGGYYSELRIYPELEVGSAIIFNRSGFVDERILNKVDGNFLSQ